MLSLYDMATGELVLQGKSHAAATDTPERRTSEFLCPTTALQEITAECWPEPPTLPPELATASVDSFLDRQK